MVAGAPSRTGICSIAAISNTSGRTPVACTRALQDSRGQILPPGICLTQDVGSRRRAHMTEASPIIMFHVKQRRADPGSSTHTPGYARTRTPGPGLTGTSHQQRARAGIMAELQNRIAPRLIGAHHIANHTTTH